MATRNEDAQQSVSLRQRALVAFQQKGGGGDSQKVSTLVDFIHKVNLQRTFEKDTRLSRIANSQRHSHGRQRSV
jgi:hypothetical protein